MNKVNLDQRGVPSALIKQFKLLGHMTTKDLRLEVARAEWDASQLEQLEDACLAESKSRRRAGPSHTHGLVGMAAPAMTAEVGRLWHRVPPAVSSWPRRQGPLREWLKEQVGPCTWTTVASTCGQTYCRASLGQKALHTLLPMVLGRANAPCYRFTVMPHLSAA